MNEVRTKLGLPNKGRVEVHQYEARSAGKPAKKKEGHDDLISRLRMRSTISIITLNGDVIHGLLQESDRFTITVRIPKPGLPMQSAFDDPQKILLVYKHAIETFFLTKLDANA